MSRWWQNLTPRERLLLGGAAPVAMIALGWGLVWAPIQQSRAELQDRIAAARTAEAALARPTTQAAAPPRNFADPVSVRVTRSADASGVALTRIEPQGTGLTVLVDEAAFESVLAWIAVLERDEGLNLTAISLDRRAAPGIVSARLELEPQT